MLAAVLESEHTMDLLLPFALLGLLLLAALSFLFAGDKLFWLLAVPTVLIGGPMLVFIYIANQSMSPTFGAVVAVIAVVAIIVLVSALVRRRLRWATLLTGPLLAGATMVLHAAMLITGGSPILLLIGFMGGGIEFWLYSALALFLLGALPILVIAWKSPRWARIVVSSLFGMLVMASLTVRYFGFIDRSRPSSPLAYLAALAVAGLLAALGMVYQYYRQRVHLNTATGERAPA
jgi:hypothetical protein